MRLNETDLVKNQSEVRRAEQARAILDNPLWGEIRAKPDASLKETLLKAPIDDHKALVHLKLFAQAIGEFEHELTRISTTGKLADAALREHHSTLQRMADSAARVFKRKA